MGISKRAISSYKQLIIKGNDFADELTKHNVVEHDLATPAQKSKALAENRTVRRILLKRRIWPVEQITDTKPLTF